MERKPCKVLVSKDNVIIPQKALLSSLRLNDIEENPYNTLQQENGKMYSIMHDETQKFQLKLDGVLIRTLSTNLVANVPWMLKKIPGGLLNAENLTNHLLDVIKSVKPLDNNTANIILSNLHNLAQCFIKRIIKQ